jgi:hypothetical protein
MCKVDDDDDTCMAGRGRKEMEKVTYLREGGDQYTFKLCKVLTG